MKKSRFTDNQIMAILNQAEAGTSVAQLCREHGMSNASFYKWRSRFGGMDVSMMTRLKGLCRINGGRAAANALTDSADLLRAPLPA